LRPAGPAARLDAVVIFLPLVMVLLVFGVVAGQTSLIVLLPMVLVLAGGAVFVGIAMRDGRRPPDPSVRQLPTDHLRRQLYLALRPQRRAARQEDQDEPSD
jgi:hypothetical protein